MWHMVRSCGDPEAGSNLRTVDEFYPFEKVSVRAKHYIEAAYEHLLMWADHVAPFKFHDEQVVNFSLRPTFTLARAALESAAQAVWLLSAEGPVECVRRHLCLIRWDIAEHRKSAADAAHKERCRQRDADLLARVASRYTEDELAPPNGYLDVLKHACLPVDLALNAADIERLWRAASGAAHGKYWPNLELQRTVVGVEFEPGHFRALTLPDSAAMVEVIEAANAMSQYAALKYLVFAGADPAALMGPASRWLLEHTTLSEDADPEVLARLAADRPEGWGDPAG